MNSRSPVSSLFDRAPQLRLVLAIGAGALVWLVVLIEMGRWLAAAPSTPVLNEPLEMHMVELAPPPVQNAAQATPQSPPKTPVTPTRLHTPREHTTQTNQLQTNPRAQQSLAPSPQEAKSVSNAPQHSASPAEENAPAVQPAATQVNTAAHSIAQPLPELPDDLREQAYQTVATARFKIHADGTVDVELIKPTSNPRLNQILLEALHQWRFFPALQNGHPIESQQEIRVHFNVD